MTLLLVHIPPRPRLRAQGPDASSPTVASEFHYVLSNDGLTVETAGHCAAVLLPKAQQVVAVLADTDVAWHRVVLPKAPSGRLAQALAGVMEDVLLEDADQTHLAAAPDAVPGQNTWIAATHRSWLSAHLAALEKAQVWVDRVVPSSWPDEPPSGHFWRDAEPREFASDDAPVQLTWVQAQGVTVLPLQGNLAKTVLGPSASEELTGGMRWTTTADAAEEAQAWLGAPVAVLNPGQRSLAAARTLWNLRQFDLAKTHRGSRWVRLGWRQWRTPAWRPVRYGLAGLVLVQLLGLNLWASHLKDQIASQRKQITTVLQKEFPQVQAVLDAPVQMEREVQSLRLKAGQSSNNDLEPLLTAAAAAWPADRGPAPDFRYEAGQLSLSTTGWSPTHLQQFSEHLRLGGWQAQIQEGRVLVRPAAATATSRTAPGAPS